jgi:hypothetical protein
VEVASPALAQRVFGVITSRTGIVCLQAYQPGLGMPEATLPVERLHCGFIVDVQPNHAVASGLVCCPPCQLASNALTAQVRVYGWVQQKGVFVTIPGHVHKPDQLLILVGTDVRQAVAKGAR